MEMKMINNKYVIKHKKAASAKIKEQEIKFICKCVNCKEPQKKHNSKCCFLPNRHRSTPFEKNECRNERCKCSNKSCGDVQCELFAYKLWNEVTPSLVKSLLTFSDFYYNECSESRELLKKIATDFPDYKLDGLLIPNWVTRNFNFHFEKLRAAVSIGFNYDKKEFIDSLL